MTSPSNSPLIGLIKHAQRHMAYMRNSRRSYATPSKWVQRQHATIIDTVSTSPDLHRVDRSQTTLAARWAVADARRDDHPEHARKLDREVERTGITRSELESARWHSYDRGWQDGVYRQETRQDPSTPAALSAAAVPVAAGLVVAASLYANASDWDEQSADQLVATDAQWADPVAVPVDTGSAEADAFDPEAALPDDLHAAPIEVQLGHVAAGGGTTTPGGEGVAAAPAPQVGAEPGVGM